jgi:Na+/melibiose symporter-like transporter
MFVTPKLKQHFTKKTLYQASLVLGFFAHITLYFLGYQNAWVNYAFLFIMGLSLGLNDVLTYTMVGDCVDAYEQKSGLRTEGLSFAFHTFTTKLQSAFGLFFIGFLLDQSGFIENTLQQPKAMAAIFSLITLYPAIASLLGMIPMAWYDIKEKRTQ